MSTITLRWFTAGQHNNMCFHISCYLRWHRWHGSFLTPYRGFQSVSSIRSSNVLNRSWRSMVAAAISATVIYFWLLRSEASNILARSMALAGDVPLPTISVKILRSASLSSMMYFTDGIGYTSRSFGRYIISYKQVLNVTKY